MSQHREYQKSKLYKWEDEVIRPRSPRTIKFEDAQTFVDGVWLCEGLLYPPKVQLMPVQATTIYARGCREYIEIRPVTPAWIIIHELAHTMTMEVYTGGHEAAHGADYLGIYIKLLDKYCGIPLALSMYSLTQTKLKYNLAAQPVFVGA
jgi:hypothetical protein